jgi:acetyl esterase/lipase
MPADTPTDESAPDLRALIESVASHPDPWFSALAQAYLAPKPSDEHYDGELVARLEDQVASGEYQGPAVAVENTAAPGPHGNVPLRVYNGDRSQDGPVLVWCHGGGFLGGDLDMPEADATAREVAVRAGAVVVSVDYRLATHGVHFPVPHDDALAAYDWTVERFGRASIGGASAGANLAAGVSLRLRDEGRPPVSVVLLYPLVHPQLPPASDELREKLAKLPQQHAFRDAGFTPMVQNYLGAPWQEASPYAMAGLGALEGLPPHLIINCEYDGLRASGELYAEALSAAGVPVTQLLAPDVLHGHINSPWLPQAQQSYADMAQWLGERG